MKLRTALFLSLFVLAGWVVPANAQQSLDINLGVFAPKPEDARITNDVLVVNRNYLWFDIEDFDGFYGEAALTSELGKYFEVSFGAGAYQRTVPSAYADQVHSDGYDIEQDLKLRIIPITAQLRMFPLGHRRSVQPYVSAGAAVNFWRYSETGEFVDFTDDSIYRASFVGKGTAVGPVGAIGVRARMTSQTDIGAEFRYSWAEADLNTNDFLSDKLDLGGASLLVTMKFRF
jgi:hypothetical protein